MVTVADMPKGKKNKPGRRTEPDSKRSQGQDRHTKPRKAFHADEKLFAALQRYIDDTRPTPSDSECLRVALEEFLQKRGYWPPEEAADDGKAE